MKTLRLISIIVLGALVGSDVFSEELSLEKLSSAKLCEYFIKASKTEEGVAICISKRGSNTCLKWSKRTKRDVFKTELMRRANEKQVGSALNAQPFDPKEYCSNDENRTIQRVPHNAGELLYIDSKFAIHSGQWRDAIGLPLCDPSTGMEAFVVLNATPDYKVTKEWLWNEFRPVLMQVAEEKCPNTHQLFANFYFKGIDVRVRIEHMRNLSGPMVDRQFTSAELEFYEPYRVDSVEYPKVDPTKRSGPGGEQYILGFTRDEYLGEPIVRAVFQYPDRWARKFPEYLERLKKEGKSLGNTSFSEFSPKISAGDGSLVGYLKARNQYTQRQIAHIRKSNEVINFSVKVLLGMMAAWECGRDYHDWCSGIHKELGAIDLAPND